MAALEFSGTVNYYDGGGLLDVGPRIDGADVIAAIETRWPWGSHGGPNVKVYLGVEPVATGPVWAIHGFAGTDVTPYDSPEIKVGDFDLLERLRDLDGREVLLIVEDA